MKTIIISLALALLAFGCASERFQFNTTDSYPIEGLIMCNPDSIDIAHDNAITLFPESRIALRISELTQFVGDFTVEIQAGSGVQFAFRTIADHFADQPKVTFDYTTDGCIVRENDRILTRCDSIRARHNEPMRMKIENYGKAFRITVDCDTVYYGYTNLRGSEYVIISTLNKSAAFVSGIVFAEIYDD
jgi:hypothetical protein